jgi:hypothetical protein
MGNLAPLSRVQRRTLARLSRFLRERGLYLAGGVAVAVHRKHRRSLDLDFFSLHAPLDLAGVRDALVQEGLPLDLLRALTYFEDAERVPTFPRGLTRRHWQDIRAWFEEHAATALRRHAAKASRNRSRR